MGEVFSESDFEAARNEIRELQPIDFNVVSEQTRNRLELLTTNLFYETTLPRIQSSLGFKDHDGSPMFNWNIEAHGLERTVHLRVPQKDGSTLSWEIHNRADRSGKTYQHLGRTEPSDLLAMHWRVDQMRGRVRPTQAAWLQGIITVMYTPDELLGAHVDHLLESSPYPVSYKWKRESVEPSRRLAANRSDGFQVVDMFETSDVPSMGMPPAMTFRSLQVHVWYAGALYQYSMEQREHGPVKDGSKISLANGIYARSPDQIGGASEGMVIKLNNAFAAVQRDRGLLKE